ncbi:MAG: phosphonate C-P lyase system protein PhnH [Pseudomonadota bacterium]
MDGSHLQGGFADPAIDAARAFRSVMDAMARPGQIYTLQGAAPPQPLSVAAGAVVLTLCDADTPIFLGPNLDTPGIQAWIAFHTGAPFAGRSECMFALGNWSSLTPLEDFPHGRSDYPDRSATLIVEMPEISVNGPTLRGPGIQGSATLSLPETVSFRRNHAMSPCGLDFIFTSGNDVAALPRSTEVI